MESWQAELIGRIVGEVDECAGGRLSLGRLVQNARGLFDAADMSDGRVRESFESVLAPLDSQLELRTETWSRPEWISEQDLKVALSDLRDWASGVSGGDSSL